MKDVNPNISNENLYYMLCYAYKCPFSKSITNHKLNSFDNALDLLAIIVLEQTSKLLKRGLNKGYITKSDNLSCIRGKINLDNTIKLKISGVNKVSCEYDEYSEDILFNQIIKSTIEKLLVSKIDKSTKSKLKGIMPFFYDVSNVNVRSIDWNARFNRINMHYRMLVIACYLILNKKLFSNSLGDDSVPKIIDDQFMHQIYEKFLLNYFKKEHKNELNADSKQVKWAIKDEEKDEYLPSMQTDVYLKSKSSNQILIIDAKYYPSLTTMHNRGTRGTFISGHLYQILSYVKNEAANKHDYQINGMLLYPLPTESEVRECHSYNFDGNTISVMPLPLGGSWIDLTTKLDQILNWIV